MRTLDTLAILFAALLCAGRAVAQAGAPAPATSPAPAPASASAQASTPAPSPAAAPTPAPAAAPSVVEPQVGRRDLKLPNYPSRDIEIGIWGGLYSKEGFGTSGSSGLRLGYHITEDFFVTAMYGRTKVSDDNFRQVLPGGVFVNRTEPLTYATVGIGYNIVPGEVFCPRVMCSPLPAPPSSRASASRPSTSASACASCSRNGSHFRPRCATTSSASTCWASARPRTTTR
jgi:hypothetical protein